MIELLLQRKAQLKELYKKTPDIELVYRLREVELMIKRYKKLIEAEVDAAAVSYTHLTLPTIYSV